MSKPKLTAIFKLHAAVFAEIQAWLFTVVSADMRLKKLLQREALEAVWAWIGTLSLMLGPYVKPQVFRGVEVLGAGLTLTFSVLAIRADTVKKHRHGTSPMCIAPEVIWHHMMLYWCQRAANAYPQFGGIPGTCQSP